MPARAATRPFRRAATPALGFPAARSAETARLLLLMGAASLAFLAPFLAFSACALANMAPAPATALIEAGAYLL